MTVTVVAALAATGVAAGLAVSGADSREGSAPVAIAPAIESAATTQPAPRAPKRLRLWKFDAPVVPVKLEGGALDPPSDPEVLGWWGQPAGAAGGTTLLVGHTVSTGGGTLDDLEHTTVGSVAKVSGVRYRVDRVTVITKAQLARRAPRLFDQTGTPKLVLVTCEGYDSVTRTYADNVVVVATPIGAA
ncbi:class F sortase [Nocardioides sp.]|uniref:class F sortase n=1 Tax=Nocardioides sp. TaxID=35761 RepID=UPI002ED4DFC9